MRSGVWACWKATVGMDRSASQARERDSMARFGYALLWFIATPFIALYLLWRARRQPAYRRGWRERFCARYGPRPSGTLVWIHAVSVGETRAAGPLVAALRSSHPGLVVLLTHMTPTGREAAIDLFGDSVLHAYLAYDYPHAVRRFFLHWQPALGIVMETEIWPNLMAAAERAGVPMVLANARLSQKSLAGALRWKALIRPALLRFARVLAQTDGDAARFALLAGVDASAAIVRVGNIKFDIEVNAVQRALAARFREWLVPQDGATRRAVLLAASTREGEEALLLDAFCRRQTESTHDDTSAQRVIDFLLVIVPRHPQRVDEVARLVAARGLTMQRRSESVAIASGTQVWLGDSMGEMLAYYAAADLAYVGGSLVPLGGQNLIEACALGCPVLVGPHTFNFADATDDAVAAGAARRVADADALMHTAATLLADEAARAAMAEAGSRFVAAHRGATVRTVVIVGALLRERATTLQ